MLKKPILPELTVPMHQSTPAFKIDFEKEGIDDRDAHQALRGNAKVDEMMGQVNEVRSKILADRTMNDAAKKAAFLRFVNKKSNDIKVEIQKVSHIVDRRSDELSAKMNAPITSEAGGREAPEIRRHVASLPKKTDRLRFIKNRVDDNDFETASAVLGSKFYLAGLDAENQQSLLDYYREKRFSAETTAIEGLEKVGQAALHKIAILEKFKKSIQSKQTIADIAGQDAVKEALHS